MKYTNLSFADLRNICISEAQRISSKSDVDLIIFVERAGLPLALYMNEVLKCKTLGIRAERKADKLKAVFFRLGGAMLPMKVKNFLRLMEYKSGFHKKNPERHAAFHTPITESERQARHILVIDDSVDTGASMLSVCNKVRETFPNAQILTYALNVFAESEELIKIDFFTIRDSIIRTPMSKDSKEHGEFIAMCEAHGLIDHSEHEAFTDAASKYLRNLVRKFTDGGGGHRESLRYSVSIHHVQHTKSLPCYYAKEALS